MRKYNGLVSAIKAMEYEAHLLKDELKHYRGNRAFRIHNKLQNIYLVTRVLRQHQNKG